jgi:hypothetical protein
MAKEIQAQAGRCSTHGTVQATREIPQMGFPYVVYAIWRAVAHTSAQNAEQQSRQLNLAMGARTITNGDADGGRTGTGIS